MVLEINDLKDLSADELAELYIQLRDRKAALEESKRQVSEAMEIVEAKMLMVLEETGAESIATPHGTFFRKEVTKYSIEDWQSFWEFVTTKTNGEFVTKSPRKAAVDEYRQQFGELPPGIGALTEITINVRRK